MEDTDVNKMEAKPRICQGKIYMAVKPARLTVPAAIARQLSFLDKENVEIEFISPTKFMVYAKPAPQGGETNEQATQ